MKSLEMFAEDLAKEFNKQFPDYVVKVVRKIRLNNAEFVGLEISMGQLKPAIYLEDAYEYFLSGISLQKIPKIVMNQINPEEVLAAEQLLGDGLKDFSLIKDKICYKLIDTERNWTIVDDLVSVEYLNLSLVFYFPVGTIGNVTIRKDMLKDWKITEKEIFEIAKINSPVLHPLIFMELQEVTVSLMTGGFSTIDLAAPDENAIKYSDNKFLLSSEKELFGATVIFYSGVLEQLYRFFGNVDYFIVPSSIHNLIIMSVDNDVSIIQAMLDDINNTQDSNEILSNELYIYRGQNKAVEIYRQ